MKVKIKVLLTGGTIDKRYDELKSTLVFAKSYIDDMLRTGRSKAELTIEQLMMIDSLDMTDERRQAILQACQAAAEDQIIILHGTSTMIETAQTLGPHLADKTVVLTGSMIPYSFGESDALFNLGSAVTAVQLLRGGVYIVMNGQIFSWDNVTRNEQGEFENLV